MTEMFNLLTFIQLTLFILFVLNKQVKKEVRNNHSNLFLKIGVPSEELKKGGKSLKNNCEIVFFGKVDGCRPAHLQKVNFFTDILQEFC